MVVTGFNFLHSVKGKVVVVFVNRKKVIRLHVVTLTTFM